LSNIAKKAVEYKVKANNLFKKGRYTDAIRCYDNALEELNAIDRKYYDMMNLSNITLIRVECLNNIAMCYLVLKEFEKVINFTNNVLEVNDNNFLALSYKAKALIGLNRKNEAVEFIKNALRIKYSRSLMNNLRDIEGEIKVSSKESTSQEDSIEKIPPSKKKNSIFRLFMILKLNTIQFFRTNKFLLLILLLVIIILVRKRALFYLKKLFATIRIYNN
jgi:tetratricopeptide (TPR) repeat protein